MRHIGVYILVTKSGKGSNDNPYRNHNPKRVNQYVESIVLKYL